MLYKGQIRGILEESVELGKLELTDELNKSYFREIVEKEARWMWVGVNRMSG